MTFVHAKRLGNRTISVDGEKLWPELRELPELAPYLIAPELVEENAVLPLIKSDCSNLSVKEYPLCYAFDVYRRGWQYLERVRKTNSDALYIPHKLRLDALDAGGSKDWTMISERQAELWSWGGYVCEILREKEYPAYKSADEIVKFVERIKSALEKTEYATWDTTEIIDENGYIRNHQKLNEIKESIINTANVAKLPILAGAIQTDVV